MSINKDFHLTQEGLDELTAELAQLKVRRIEVAKNLKIAKDLGDISENADWANAQDEHKFIEGRISDIEHILKNVDIIGSSNGSKKIQLGSSVELQHDGKTVKYVVVGSLESDPYEGKISNESPIGSALMGKEVGDKVEIKVPTGSTTYKITKIT